MIQTGTATTLAAAGTGAVAGGIAERGVASRGNLNVAMGTPSQIATDAAIGVLVQGVSSTGVVDRLVKASTSAGKAVTVGEAKLARGTVPSPRLPERQAQLARQQKIASGGLGAAVDTSNRVNQTNSRKKKDDDLHK